MMQKNGDLLVEVILEALIKHTLDKWIDDAIKDGEVIEVETA